MFEGNISNQPAATIGWYYDVLLIIKYPKLFRWAKKSMPSILKFLYQRNELAIAQMELYFKDYNVKVVVDHPNLKKIFDDEYNTVAVGHISQLSQLPYFRVFTTDKRFIGLSGIVRYIMPFKQFIKEDKQLKDNVAGFAEMMIELGERLKKE